MDIAIEATDIVRGVLNGKWCFDSVGIFVVSIPYLGERSQSSQDSDVLGEYSREVSHNTHRP